MALALEIVEVESDSDGSGESKDEDLSSVAMGVAMHQLKPKLTTGYSQSQPWFFSGCQGSS